MDEKHKEIVEVRTVFSDHEANNHLAHGWILLITGPVYLNDGPYRVKTYFTLGRKEAKD